MIQSHEAHRWFFIRMFRALAAGNSAGMDGATGAAGKGARGCGGAGWKVVRFEVGGHAAQSGDCFHSRRPDHRCRAFGPDSSRGAQVIDLTAATVLPGLIDSHLHVMDGGGSGPNISQQYRELVALRNAERDLNAGFTTIVDLMSHGGMYGTVDLRNAINRGLVKGPRMQVSGPGIVNTNKAGAPWVAGAPVSFVGAQVANTPWGVREAVREQAQLVRGWTGSKIYSTERLHSARGRNNFGNSRIHTGRNPGYCG